MYQQLHEKIKKRILSESINGEITITKILEILDNELLVKPIYSQHYPNMEALYDSFMEVFDNPPIRIKSRKRSIVAVRQLFWYQCKDIFGSKYTLEDMGKFIGGKKPYDHTSVIHSILTVQDHLSKNDELILSLITKFKKYNNEKFGI